VTVAALTCQEFVELVTDYLEGRMSPAGRARFERHLALCGGCQAYLDQMRETLAALGRLPQEELSGEARDALLAAFRGWRSAR
jgi:anti-sigma factor RsiW